MQDPSPAGRKLKVDLEELAMAFEDVSGLVSYYLDLKTGEMILVTEDVLTALNEIYRELEESGGGDEGESGLTFNEALAQMELADWLSKAVEAAKGVYQIENDPGGRYIPVSQADSRAGYIDMADFIQTIQDERLQERLEDAIGGLGAFRRFKNVLAYFPDEREQWFHFKNGRVRGRVVDWLQGAGFELE